MTRTAVVVTALAVLVGLALAGAITLTGGGDDGAPRAGRSPTSERAAEAESHGAGELPAVEAAARRFLAGYLPLIYGKPSASIDRLSSASPRLVARLRSEGGHVTPAQAERRPHLERVTVIKEGTISALATAQIKDSRAGAYPLVFHLQDSPDGWLVTRIGGP